MRQLQAAWSEDGKAVVVSRDGEELLRHPVEKSRRTHSWLKPGGNGKLSSFGRTGIGVLNTVRNGCFRALTGCDRCDVPCYTEEGVSQSGCFSQNTAFAMLRWGEGFNVIHNGYIPGTERFLSVHVPKDGNLDLSMYPCRVWRVASESSTACFDLSLGMTQGWARRNPDRVFAAVSSAYFRVPDERLAEAADCGNIVVGLTWSAWLGMDDLRNRMAEARRYHNFGVPVVIWVATNPEWCDSNRSGWQAILDELRLYDPRQLIEVPYHTRAGHTKHIMDSNPWGGCCEFGFSSCGRLVNMDLGSFVDDGTGCESKVNGACARCKNACGASWLKVSRSGRG